MHPAGGPAKSASCGASPSPPPGSSSRCSTALFPFGRRPVATRIELAQRIFLPALHFDTRGSLESYWVCEDWIAPGPANAPAVLRKARAAPFGGPSRHGSRTHRAPVKPLPDLEVCRVRNGPRRKPSAPSERLFPRAAAWFNEVFDSPSVWERFAGYVGYVDGEPVSTAAIVLGAGALGVYNVATMPEHAAPRLRGGRHALRPGRCPRSATASSGRSCNPRPPVFPSTCAWATRRLPRYRSIRCNRRLSSISRMQPDI